MRLYSIMKCFVEEKNYLSLDYFINKFEVSKRTIQNDLSYLMRISSRKGFQLHTKRGAGYLLEITNENLFNDFLDDLNSGVSFHVKERPSHILAYLAIQNNYVSIDSIAQTFQVSNALIKHDMKDVEKLANSYHFELEKRAHYGIRLQYEMTYLKKYLVEAYLNENVFIQSAVNEVVCDFDDVEQTLVKQLNKEGLTINYNELLNVIEYLKVIVYTSYVKKEQKDEFGFNQMDSIHRVAEFLISALEKKYHVFFNLESIKDVINILNKNIKRETGNLIESENLEEDIELFIKNIDEIYDSNFSSDEDFKKMLLAHVSLLIDRLHNKISYQNPLANELNITYPMMFNIAIQFCNMVHEKYDVEVTFDEIGFVAMHFATHMEKEKLGKLMSYNRIGIVCSSGGGSAYMIKIQIESLFPKAQVQTYSYIQQDELKAFEPDLIFTVIPLSIEIKAPVIYIKELLDDKDLVKIKQILQCEEYDPYILINEHPMYNSFYSKEFFKFVEANDYETLLKKLGHELEEKGYGQPGFTNLVLERESYVSTIYMNGVCIPHPIETDANKSIISVAILKEPFIQNDKEVKIVFMICLKKDQVEMYKVITQKLYLLMQNPAYVNMMVNVNSFEEMMSVMKLIGRGTNE
ncbi:BglG family transcription antiterminator [Floccifex sp.]|uniref:BglG family transcription antiterminator n=1 Tax=Floccifex sp. TaxID=2815810 RepID=UPI003F1167B7